MKRNRHAPLGVSIIAALTWFVGAILALAGLSVIGLTDVGARLLTRVADVHLLQRLTSGLGTSIGIVLLLTAPKYLGLASDCGI